MKPNLLLSRAAALAFCASTLGAAIAAHAGELKFSIFAPPKSFTVTQLAAPWTEWLKGKAGAEADVKIFAGGTLGRNPALQLKLVEDGVADIAWIVPSYTPARFPELAVFELPGVVRDAHEGTKAIWRMYQAGQLSGFDNLKVLALYTTDVYQIHTAEPFASISELTGKKLRSGGAVQNEIISALGAAPIGMPVTKITESMSRNLIDGVILNWTSMRPFTVDDVAKFHYNIELGVLPLAIVMTKKVFEAQPAKFRRALDESHGFLNARGAEAFEKDRVRSVAALYADPGHKIVEPSVADRRAFEKAFDALMRETRGGPKGKALRDLEAALRAVRAAR